MAKITKGMVDHLNDTLKSMGCGFKYTLYDETTYSPRIQVGVIDTCEFVDNSIVNGTPKYYEWLNKFFMDNYGITLCYNNTRSIVWSNDYGI